MNSQDIIIYQSKDGKVELKVSLKQLSELFGRDKSVISRHLNNIFKNNELDKGSVVAKNATTASCVRTTCRTC